AAEMPERFGLVFDGWSHAAEHYVAVFAWYEVAGDRGAVAGYNKRLEQCLFLVVDNCSVNRCLATLMGVPLIGCADTEATNLKSFCKITTEDDPSTNHPSANSLGLHVRDAKSLFRASSVPGHRGRSDRRAAAFCGSLLGELKGIESVSKALQGGKVNLLDVRVWFDGLIAAKEQYSRYYAPRADIVHSPDFESGCVRVLKGQAFRLTRAEKAALGPFLAATPTQGAQQKENEASASFVERLQKRRRLEERQPAYELLGSISPTTNVVERFFSVARTTFGMQRHSPQPYTLEMLLFLRQNTGYWDARTVESAE
ncbi:hypothetical protein JG688_00013496, partial [Phytophthora aleatoria]